MEHTVEEIARKLDAQGLWELLYPCHWAIKAKGVAFPYFCAAVPGDNPALKTRLLLLEGWQTFHDYLRLMQDRFYGWCLSPMELPHYELVVLKSGESALYRHDPGYMPRPVADEPERRLCAKLLWEVVGMMMRLENDPKLPLAYSSEQASFARLQGGNGRWSDAPLRIPEPRPHVERVAFAKELVAKVQDLPFEKDVAIEIDFRLRLGMMTREKRPRLVYALGAVETETGARVMMDLVSMDNETGLKGMWEGMPPRVLERIFERGRVPGRIRTCSARVFRLLRPLCLELPIRLSMHDRLPKLEEFFNGPL